MDLFQKGKGKAVPLQAWSGTEGLVLIRYNYMFRLSTSVTFGRHWMPYLIVSDVDSRNLITVSNKDQIQKIYIYIYIVMSRLITKTQQNNAQGGSNMTGTDLYVNKPHCAAAVRP